MPRKEGLALESKFVRGLITESTALNFPADAAYDTLDCVFNEKGYVTRRPGFDLETGYAENSITVDSGHEAYNTYVWDYIKNGVDKAFLVCQQGAYVHFFDISDNVTPSANKHLTTINLTDYRLPTALGLPRQWRCQFAEANGYLLIVNRYCFPMYLTYTGSDFDITTMTLKVRDFKGIDDGTPLTLRPITSVAAAKTAYPDHLYNLYNAGWTDEYLRVWDTAVTTLPSRADAAGYFRLSSEEILNSFTIAANDPGSSPAPTGRFILPVGSEDRSSAIAEFNLDLVLDGGVNTPLSGGLGTDIGDATNLSNAFNGTYPVSSGSTASAAAVTDMYVGKQYSTVRRIARATVHSSTDQGFVASLNADARLELYGSNTAPANSTDGNLLGSSQFSDALSAGGVRTVGAVVNNNPERAYTYFWVRFSKPDGTNDTFYCGELLFYDAVFANESVSSVAFFAGRAWYAGINTAELGNRLYFSQVLDDENKFPLCYQVNDPSSDKYADLLATDGGSITIPDMNQVKALFNFQSQLLVLASNGIWLITGGQGGIFSATDYRVRRISSIGIMSPESMVDVKGLPIWWGEDGIYTVQYDANYDSTVVKNLTEETVKTFFLAIPPLNRQYVKGVYDQKNDVVMWLYHPSATLSPTTYYVYTRALCLNVKSGAFYPWQIGASPTTLQKVRGAAYIQDGLRQLEPVVVYPVSYNRAGTDRLTFAKVANTSYKDWTSYAVRTGATTDEVDYTSYFITGYRLDGTAMTHFQAPYVYSYLTEQANASAFMQGLFDFTQNASSGKWSTPQQAYNFKTALGRSHHDPRVSRLVVRGSGKAMRCKYYSESGKPFTILGWGLLISGTDRV